MTKLKECPFCGSEARIVKRGTYGSAVECSACNSGTDMSTESSAKSLWNLRTPAPMTSVIERIAAAAYCHDGYIISLPAPARHHNIIRLLGDLPGQESGFLTSAGRFVDRKEGYNIAEQAGQLNDSVTTPGTLFSEYVW